MHDSKALKTHVRMLEYKTRATLLEEIFIRDSNNLRWGISRDYKTPERRAYQGGPWEASD